MKTGGQRDLGPRIHLRWTAEGGNRFQLRIDPKNSSWFPTNMMGVTYIIERTVLISWDQVIRWTALAAAVLIAKAMASLW